MFSAFTNDSRCQIGLKTRLKCDQLLQRKLKKAELSCTAWERRGKLK
jgi:hypothetical protein